MARKKGLGKGGTSLELSKPYHVKNERVVTFHKKEEEIGRERDKENLFTWPFVWDAAFYGVLSPQRFMEQYIDWLKSTSLYIGVYPAGTEDWYKLFERWQRGLFPWFSFK